MAAPVSVRVNVDRSLIVDYRGLFSGAEISAMETQHRESVKRYREEFGRSR